MVARPLNFRNEDDLKPEKKPRFRRPAVFVSTAGKAQAEIVRDVVRAMRRTGLLKPE